MKRIFSILSIFAVIIGCQAHGTDTGNIIPVVPVVYGTEYCSYAQIHLYNLCQSDPGKNHYCCEVVAPTKKGKSFQDFCIETQNNGISLDPLCIIGILNCEDIDKCTHTIITPTASQCENGSCAYPRK